MTTTKNPEKLPRLIACMQKQAILSKSEAISAIVAHRQGDGRYGGAEAVVHYGGATRIIREAFRHRGWWMFGIYSGVATEYKFKLGADR